jgi:16S rRNA (uracil1498-N3)-methyltransferase
MIRLHVAEPPLAEGLRIALAEAAARHAQVRRVQPGDVLRLFDGRGHEHAAAIVSVGRRDVVVEVGAAVATVPELACAVTLAVGMPANERMDALVEKATELGVAAIQPLHAARSVLRLTGERAERRRAHWQAVAVAAAEQCGRAVVPEVLPVSEFGAWCAALAVPGAPVQPGTRVLLSLSPQARHALEIAPVAQQLVLSGPEGGLTPEEEAAARAAGFEPVSLGPRVLRADTAPLAWLAAVALRPGPC